MFRRPRSRPDVHAADPARRRAAVSARTVGQNALRRLIANDPDPGVREAAARRLCDLVVLRQVFAGDGDDRVRESARARYRQLIAGGDELDLRYRRAALTACPDAQIIAHVARSAREPVLRADAVDRIVDRNLLAEVAAHDADPAIRARAGRRLAADHPSAGDQPPSGS